MEIEALLVEENKLAEYLTEKYRQGYKTVLVPGMCLQLYMEDSKT